MLTSDERGVAAVLLEDIVPSTEVEEVRAEPVDEPVNVDWVADEELDEGGTEPEDVEV